MADKPALHKPAKTLTNLDNAVEFGPDYFDSARKTYSARVYANLSQGPAFRTAISPNPTARDKLLIASVVIGAADEKIADLEASQRLSTRMNSLLNSPMFKAGNTASAATKTQANSDAEDDSAAEPPKGESVWFQKYLTLRNFLAVFVVVAGGIGGFMAWATADYHSRYTTAQNDATYWQGQRDQYKKQVDDLTLQLRSKSQAGIDDQATIKGLKDQLNPMQKQLTEAQKTISERDKTIQTLQQSALAARQAAAQPTPTPPANPPATPAKP
jgi:hypothetical protein